MTKNEKQELESVPHHFHHKSWWWGAGFNTATSLTFSPFLPPFFFFLFSPPSPHSYKQRGQEVISPGFKVPLLPLEGRVDILSACLQISQSYDVLMQLPGGHLSPAPFGCLDFECRSDTCRWFLAQHPNPRIKTGQNASNSVLCSGVRSGGGQCLDLRRPRGDLGKGWAPRQGHWWIWCWSFL